MANTPIPEVDVLIAVVKWLHSNGWKVVSVSIPRGQGLDQIEQMKKLLLTILKEHTDFKIPEFLSFGPDIIAKKDSDTWRIECKGLGKGVSQTLRNNFDRTLSSTVSYYDKKTGLRIGLAMPNESSYRKLIRERISPALQSAINLWIFLYDNKNQKLEIIEPNNSV